MGTLSRDWRFTLVSCVVVGLADAASAVPVDLRLVPTSVVTCAGAEIEIDLVATATGPVGQPFDTLEAALQWDPLRLTLLGSDDSNAEASFFIAGFLPNADGINVNLADGDAYFSALVSPGQTVDAPPAPEDLIITTFIFEVRVDLDSTNVEIVPSFGPFSITRVLKGGTDYLGNIGPPAEVYQSCTADFSGDGLVNAVDLAQLLGNWGTPGCDGADSCCVDLNGDGAVDATDLAYLLGSWGPCPS